MGNVKESPPIGEMERAQEEVLQGKYSTVAVSLSTLATQRIWLTRREDRPLPSTYKERPERYTLQEAFEAVNLETLDGVCLFNGEAIYHDGKRLVIIHVFTAEQTIESSSFDFLRRVPTYIEKTDFGYRALYWFPDSWSAQYYGAAHVWLDSGTDIEILFGPDHSKKPFIPLTFAIPGNPYSIAAPDEAILGDSLKALLKDYELDEAAVEQTMVPFPPPFRGPMADAVAAALDAAYAVQPDLTTLAALIGMAAACGSCYILPGGGRLNLYGCGVAETGDGKDRPRKLATLVARQAVAQVIGKPASGQALEDVLISRIGMLCEIDEIGHALAAVNNSHAPSYLIELNGMFLKLFSASDSFYPPRAKAGMKVAPPVIEYPAFNMIGFTTAEVLGHAVSAEDVVNGMLGRFLFVQGKKNPQMRRKAGRLALPDSVKAATHNVRLGVSHCLLINCGDRLITVAPEVDDLLDALFRECCQRRQAGTSPFARALYARSYEKAERIMGVLAVWDNPAAPVITPEHVEWAAQVVHASDAALLSFTEEYMQGGKVQEHAAQVLRLMRRFMSGELKVKDSPSETDALKQGWVPRSALLRHAKDIDARQINEALRYLEERRDVELGRFPTTHTRGYEVMLEVVRPLEE